LQRAEARVNGKCRGRAVTFEASAEYGSGAAGEALGQELGTATNPQFAQYLSAVERAYGRHNLAALREARMDAPADSGLLPKIVPGQSRSKFLAITDVSNRDHQRISIQQKGHGTETGWLPLRTRLKREEESKGTKTFQTRFNPVTIQDLELKHSVGEPVPLTPISQIPPVNPGKTNIGLPELDYRLVSTTIRLPRLFGSQQWWADAV